jgi:serine/threonine protein kinase
VDHSETKKQSILKVSYVDEKKKDEFEKQIGFWKELCLKDMHIVILKDCFYDNLNACFFILFFCELILVIFMEYCKSRDLATLILMKKQKNEKFTEAVFSLCFIVSFYFEKEIATITFHVFSGMYSMHLLKVVHRDIKPANILITKNKIFKLGLLLVVFLFNVCYFFLQLTLTYHVC